MDGTPGIDGENGTDGGNGFPGDDVRLPDICERVCVLAFIVCGTGSISMYDTCISIPSCMTYTQYAYQDNDYNYYEDS